MFSLTPFYSILLASATLLNAAPVLVSRDVLDAASLLKNGQEAQNLNALFQNLTTADACTAGQVACIKGDLANCVNDKWQTEECPSSLSCFAIPLVSQTGTNVTCTSQKNALSAIQSTGASNQIAIASNSTDDDTCDPDTGDDGDDDDDDTCDSDNGNDGDDSSSTTSTTTVTKGGEVTVTVTVAPTTSTVSITVPPSGTVTLPPTTTTLDGPAAASLLSLLSAQGGVPVTTIVNGGGAAPSASAAPASSSSTRSIIQLTAPAATPSAADNGSGASGSAASSASSGSIILLTEAPAATPSAANNANKAPVAGTQPILTLIPAPSSATSDDASPFNFSGY